MADAGQFRQVGDTAAQVMHNGILIEKDGYSGAWTTEIIRRLRGHHEPQEELVFARTLERIAATEAAPTMIELGSWWAYYSLWFLRAHPDGRILALEPDLPYLEVGKRNFALNGVTGTFVHGAIGGNPGERLDFVAESDGRTYSVPRYTLDQLMEKAGMERITLLLADIQGAETALIEQSRDLFTSGRVRFVVISTHHWSISGYALTHQRTLGDLSELGGHIIAEHTIGESFSGDGLVVASFDPRDTDFTVEISRARDRDSLFGELEVDLATVHDRHRQELAGLRDEVEQLRVANAELKAEIEAIQQRRLWRYATGARRVYSKLRRVGGRL